MTEEIKEILEWLNDKNYYIEDFGYKFKRLSLEENEILLNYITNLQKENENLKLQIKGYEQERENVLNDIVKENERLRTELNALKMSEEEWLDATLGGDE